MRQRRSRIKQSRPPAARGSAALADRCAASGERCASCRNSLRAGARFCDACGCVVASSSAPSEFKQVTVLFADVVGSMRLAAALPPERLQALMSELFNRGAAVVQRFQGTVDKFTGDGLMALFGAPAALEDHALRACIAALELQRAAEHLAAEVRRTDDIDLAIRVGLNSGQVIAGEIGTGPGRYTAVGHSVGMAQRMESAAHPGTVLCSQSTALLVERSARLGPAMDVRVKGCDEPVPARQLLGVVSGRMVLGRDEGVLVGRDEELSRLAKLFDSGNTGLIGVIGEAGVGKTRLVAEFTASAAARDNRIVVTRCEAHMEGVGFHTLAHLMRAMFGIDASLSRAEARARAASQVPGLIPDSDDARMLFDAMGLQGSREIVELGADGRRRRLAAMMVRALRAYPARTVFVIEDVQWIDGPSDDVIAALATTADAANSMFIATYRPEFRGALHRSAATAVTLQSLSPSQARQAVRQLLGDDPSVFPLSGRITDTAAGNPLFAEEIIRDLADRGILRGARGAYRLSDGVDYISVPPTVQAVLAARIDRLGVQSKSILNAAAVIGSQFDADMLQTVNPQATAERLAELVAAKLIDQTEFVPVQRFCFHHPLVRSVAYESQLQTTRARTHVTLAEAMQRRKPFSDERAALIATHLEAAGDLPGAYRWHLRAADWLRPRDLPAARVHWDGAGRIADRLPGDDRQVLAMRTAPRMMLLSTSLYIRDDLVTDDTYAELCELTTRTGDETSLAIGMAGRSFSVMVNDSRADEALPMAVELRAMAKRIACDPQTRGIILNSAAFTEFALGDFRSALAITDEILNLPLDGSDVEIAAALSLRGFLLACLGHTPTGTRIMRDAFDLSRPLHPVRFASVQMYSAMLVALGVTDAAGAIGDARAAWQAAESFGDICGIVMARWVYGTILLRIPGSYEAGLAVVRDTRAIVGEHRLGACALISVVTDLAVDSARTGGVDEAIDTIRAVLDGALSGFPILAVFPAAALVDLLIERGTPADLAEARRIPERWRGCNITAAALNLWVLRARARIAQAEGDHGGYAGLAAGYLWLCERYNAVGRLDEARRMATAHALRAAR